jgi:hypothetical protein
VSTPDTREIEQVLARTVRELGEVQANALRAKLPKPFQRPRAELEASLKALVARGEVFRHPTVKTKFLSYDAREAVRELVRASLGPKALSEAELKRQVAKKGASLGLGRALGPLAGEALRALVRGGLAFEHRSPPPPGESKRPAPKTLRYANEPPRSIELAPYVRKAAREMKALLKRLAPFGATTAEALRAFALELGVAALPALENDVGGRSTNLGNGGTTGSPRPNGNPANGVVREAHEAHSVRGAEAVLAVPQDVPPPPRAPDVPADPEARLLWAVDRVAEGEPEGALLLVERVRARAGLEKGAFDQAALALARAELVALHYHDYPASLPASKLAEFVVDEEGTYYIGIARRRVEEA